MKSKLAIVLISILVNVISTYGQDSVRTKNDKPGTPQSLRTPDNSPQSHIKIINANVAPLQTINHGATESNQVNNTRQTTLLNTDTSHRMLIPQVPATATYRSPTPNDSLPNNASNSKKNVSNPVRK